MRRRLILCTALAVAAAVAVGSLALAGTKSVTDRKGDSRKGHADLANVSVTTTTKRVKVKIAAYNDFKTSAAPCIELDLDHNTGDGDEINLCGGGKLEDFAHGGGSVGNAKVTRPDTKTIVYRFSRRAIGKPKRIGWQVQVREGKCFQNGPCDVAPEGPGKHIYQR
jgi:hypothetical protein